MTINERVRYLRKDVLHLTQAKFANMLGMKQTGVSSFEKNDATMTDQTIKTICLVFGVNENWLRNEEGPVLIEPDTFSLDEFVKSHSASEIEMEILRAYFELDADVRQMLIEHFKAQFDKSK